MAIYTLNVVLWRSYSSNGNRLILQFHCLYCSTWCSLHLLCCTEQSHQFFCQIPEHTQGVSVPQCHTYFYNVLLWHRGNIKWSAILPCHYKYTYFSFKVGINGWNLISAQGSGWGWGRHFFYLKITLMVFIFDVRESNRLSQFSAINMIQKLLILSIILDALTQFKN